MYKYIGSGFKEVEWYCNFLVCDYQIQVRLLDQLGFYKSRFVTFDEIEIPMKCYPNFIEISMFWFSIIQFWFL
jgi:hypothetical protein